MTINVNYRLQQMNFKFGAWYGSQGFGMYELLQPEKSVFFLGGGGFFYAIPGYSHNVL